jgi:hypothetical protein
MDDNDELDFELSISYYDIFEAFKAVKDLKMSIYFEEKLMKC